MKHTWARMASLGLAWAVMFVPLQVTAQRFDFQESIDPITDVDESALGIYSDIIAEDRQRPARYGALIVRCEGDGGFEYLFRFTEPVYPSSGGFTVFVTYRFDADPAVSGIPWSINDSFDGAFGPEHVGEEFVARLARSDRFVLRFDSPTGEETLVFTTTGVGEYLERLACLP